MDISTMWIIITLGLLASALLARYSLSKWKHIKAVELAQKAKEAEQSARRKNTINSIHIIAQCLVEGQVEPSEGCIRIKVLLDHINPSLNEDVRFSIFSTIYDATKHMPTHEARKKADKQLIRKLDKERFALEDKHKAEIIRASEAIRSYKF